MFSYTRFEKTGRRQYRSFTIHSYGYSRPYISVEDRRRPSPTLTQIRSFQTIISTVRFHDAVVYAKLVTDLICRRSKRQRPRGVVYALSCTRRRVFIVIAFGSEHANDTYTGMFSGRRVYLVLHDIVKRNAIYINRVYL